MKFLWIGIMALLVAQPVSADNFVKEGITLNNNMVYFHDAYSYPTLAGTSNGAVFMSIRNGDDSPVTITGASTSVAQTAELHTHDMNDAGVMQMSEVAGGITIAANSEVTLQPGGMHIMLFGMTKPLAPMDNFTLHVTLDDGRTIDVNVNILPRP